VNLTAPEIRVLGCLLEKQRTTPDAYPLTLNALRLACNQSTNRDPVVSYDDDILRDALHRLGRRGYTRLAGASSRSPKFRHLLAEALPMGEDEQATICVLMLRGPQTPGELKQRTERMHGFVDLAGVHDTLGRLIERGLVARLERRPGQKEERYAQLLEDPDDSSAPASPGAATSPGAAAAALANAPTVPSTQTGGRQSSTTPAVPSSPTDSYARAAAATPDPTALAELTERVARLERHLAELLGDSGEESGEA
jgi:uncharacterized protein YceH (UPF0502 family)